jgi:hypothetical protein
MRVRGCREGWGWMPSTARTKHVTKQYGLIIDFEVKSHLSPGERYCFQP